MVLVRVPTAAVPSSNRSGSPLYNEARSPETLRSVTSLGFVTILVFLGSGDCSGLGCSDRVAMLVATILVL